MHLLGLYWLRNGGAVSSRRTDVRDSAIIAQPAPPMVRAQVRAGDGSRANLRPRLASSKATIGTLR